MAGPASPQTIDPMRSFLTAWHFLTVIPLPWSGGVDPEAQTASAKYYPGVGLVLGFLLVLGSILGSVLFPKALTDIGVLALLVVLTGGIHLDGFADTVDGLSSSGSREEILRVMRDGRIGALAVIAVFFLLMGKYLALNHLKGKEYLTALLLMPVAGRWAMLMACRMAPYARKSGLGQEIIGKVERGSVIFGSLLFGIFLVGLFGFRGIILFGLLGGTVIVSVRWIQRRIGGMTGDTVGAMGESVELLFLVLIEGIPRSV